MLKGKFKESAEYVVSGFIVLLITAFCIYAAYYIIKEFASTVPSVIGSTLVGLLALYISASKSKLKELF